MDPLARTVREQVALGRLLPLGAPGEALWIAESAACALLRRAAAAVAGARVGDIGVRPAGGRSAGYGDGSGAPPHDDDEPAWSEVPAVAPAGALPHTPLRVVAAFDALAGEPLPLLADRLRAVLWAAVRDGLGARAAAVDLRVTGFFDPASEHDGDEPEPADGAAGTTADARPASAGDPAEAVEAAVRAVRGVCRLTRRLSGFGAGVRVRDAAAGNGDGRAPREVQVQIAVVPGHAPVAVARAAAAAAGIAAERATAGAAATAVLVTDA